MDYNEGKKKFQIIGCLVVIIIIALVSSGIRYYLGMQEDLKECKYNVAKIVKALYKYGGDNKKLPDQLNELVPEYLDSIPTCPSAHCDTYSDSFSHTPAIPGMPVHPIVFCKGSNHTGAGARENTPRYDAMKRDIVEY